MCLLNGPRYKRRVFINVGQINNGVADILITVTSLRVQTVNNFDL